MASPTQIRISSIGADSGQPNMTRFVGLLVSAGLINASILAILVCQLPDVHSPTLFALVHSPTLFALFFRAILYVSGASLAGLWGARFYWNRSSTPLITEPPLSFKLFALSNAAGWVWVPSIVILSSQDSLVSPLLAVLASVVLALGLRKLIPSATAPLRPNGFGLAWPERELFAETLRTQPRELHGYFIAVCIYLAAYDLEDRWNLWAAGLLALCGFIITWKLSRQPGPTPENQKHAVRATVRLALVAMAAVLITTLALMFGVANRNRDSAANALAGEDSASHGGAVNQKPTEPTAIGISAYESIILWPVPEKKQIIPPLEAETNLLAPGTTKPLIIRFDAPYWYFQPPDKRPGPRAYQAHGTPLVADIQSRNFIPLVMEAHQNLGSPIPIARCREIQVTILNRDNRRGVLNVAMLLRNSAAPSKPALYLGQEPIVTSEPVHFADKSSPVTETLRFAVPALASIRKFNEITVMFLPDDANFEIGPKLAIQDFELLPR